MKRYDPVGICIYCGTTNDLRKEHIIPLGLNGDWVLPNSSCAKCEKITSSFEGRLLRGPFLLPRAALDLRTRDRNDRPTSFPLEVTKDGVSESRDVPVEKNLPSIVLPIFDPPGFLQGRDEQKGVNVNGVYVGHVHRNPQNVIDNLEVDKVAIEHNFPAMDFARLIGKVAYGYAVGELGYENVRNPLVLPAILGLTQDIGLWVGTANDAAKPPANNSLHAAKIFNEEGKIAVAVSLFCFQPSPIYLVLISKGA